MTAPYVNLGGKIADFNWDASMRRDRLEARGVNVGAAVMPVSTMTAMALSNHLRRVAVQSLPVPLHNAPTIRRVTLPLIGRQLLAE
jgi:hypothetical protein